MVGRLVTLVAVATLLAVSASAVPYMKLHHNQVTCLSEDIAGSTEVVVVDYKRRRNQFSDDAKVKITVLSPSSRSEVYSGNAKVGTSSFSFRPIKEETGEYTICLQMIGNGNEQQHVDIHIAMDHHDRKMVLPKPDPAMTRQNVNGQEVFSFVDFDGQVKETLRSKEYLERLYVMLNNVVTVSEELRHDATFFEQKTAEMRRTSESTFTRVWLFSVVTIGAMVVVGFLQYGFLKSFLKRKKLV